MSDLLVYHLDARESAALNRGNVTEREHIERHAGAAAHRFRQSVAVCSDDGERCYFTIAVSGHIIELASAVDPEAAELVGVLKAARRFIQDRSRAHDARDMIARLDPFPADLQPLWKAFDAENYDVAMRALNIVEHERGIE